MRLELKAISDGVKPLLGQTKWYFERGTRTIGRSPDCDWQLPQEQRSVSKLHCTIQRDAKGFVLQDQSANGSRVDGIVVHEGEVARLSDRSKLELGGLAFSIHISGEAEPEMEDPDKRVAMSDEPLTISAILADIAPAGRTATGILGARVSDDWPEPAAKKDGHAPSRNVDIGWNGPPETSQTKILPDDWNIETKTGGHSDYSSFLEHGSATHVAVPVSRARTDDTFRTVIENAPLRDAEDEKKITSSPDSAHSDRPLAPLVSRMEDALDATFSILGLDPPSARMDAEMVVVSSNDSLSRRMENVLARQARLQSALENLFHQTGRIMEPRIIEAHVDATKGVLRLLPRRDYWQAYKAQFEHNGRTLSVQDVFRNAMMRTDAFDGTTAEPAAEKESHDHEK